MKQTNIREFREYWFPIFLAIVVLLALPVSLAGQTSKKQGITRRQVGRQKPATKTDDSKQLDMMVEDAEAGWDTVVHSPTSILKYHPKRVNWDTDHLVSIWVKEYVKRPLVEYRQKEIQTRVRLGLSTKGYERHSYSLILWQLNCDTSQMRVLSLADYDADGNVIESSSTATAWDMIIPDSTGDAVFSKICISKFEDPYTAATTPPTQRAREWKLAASSEEMNYYYDPSSITKTDTDSVLMWEKWILRSDTAEGRRSIKENIQLLSKSIGEERSQAYGYDVIQTEYNCSPRTAREIKWFIYDRSDAVLTELETAKSWGSPEIGGLSERMMKIACSQ